MPQNEIGVLDNLALAAADGRLADMRELLERGGDPNARVNDISILRFALGQEDRPELIRCLLDAGANPNGSPAGDEELVISAVARGLPKVLRVLLDAGADIHRVNDEGRSALWYAVDGGQKECEAILREYGLDYTERELKEEEKARRLKNQQNLVMNRIRSARTKDPQDLGWLMQEAVVVDLPKHVVKLLQKGAVPNFREEHDQPTPLVWASDKGYLDVVKAALEAGSPIDEKIFYDKLAMEGTALAFAARAGHLKIVKALVEAGADPNATSIGEDGQGPPLFFAEKHGFKKVCDYLRPLTERG